MSFPDTKFGICPICGANSGDYAAGGLTLADSQTNIVRPGTGVVLVEYQGKLMCENCRREKQADEESLASAKKHAQEQRFRDKVGFVDIVP